MQIGVFDSGLGGLTVVKAISELFCGGTIIYIADTKFAPYGEKSKEQIQKHSFDVAEYLILTHNIDALIVACNTATSAAIHELREKFPQLIVIGTEPGIKPAVAQSRNKKIGILATKATLKGEKYQLLLDSLEVKQRVKLFEQACPGLVEQIENGKIEDKKTYNMLFTWLKNMKENSVDTIVLGCTHYPLVSKLIKNIMGESIILIETGTAIAKRLLDLSVTKKLHNNIGKLEIKVYYTGTINLNMIDTIILQNWDNCGKIEVVKNNE